MSFLTLPNDIGLGGEGAAVLPQKKIEKQDKEGKTDQDRIQKAGIPPGLFAGVLKTLSF